jgi:hypothetical protein
VCNSVKLAFPSGFILLHSILRQHGFIIITHSMNQEDPERMAAAQQENILQLMKEQISQLQADHAATAAAAATTAAATVMAVPLSEAPHLGGIYRPNYGIPP